MCSPEHLDLLTQLQPASWAWLCVWHCLLLPVPQRPRFRPFCSTPHGHHAYPCLPPPLPPLPARRPLLPRSSPLISPARLAATRAPSPHATRIGRSRGAAPTSDAHAGASADESAPSPPTHLPGQHRSACPLPWAPDVRRRHCACTPPPYGHCTPRSHRCRRTAPGPHAEWHAAANACGPEQTRRRWPASPWHSFGSSTTGSTHSHSSVDLIPCATPHAPQLSAMGIDRVQCCN